jgi:hypothetical protein
MASVRRLTAILAADVAGYSRLMGTDEEGTHERLKAHLEELVDPKIKEHRGRVVKNTGDGLLAEFASVVDAVRCAKTVDRSRHTLGHQDLAVLGLGAEPCCNIDNSADGRVVRSTLKTDRTESGISLGDTNAISGRLTP